MAENYAPRQLPTIPTALAAHPYVARQSCPWRLALSPTVRAFNLEIFPSLISDADGFGGDRRAYDLLIATRDSLRNPAKEDGAGEGEWYCGNVFAAVEISIEAVFCLRKLCASLEIKV